MGIIFDQILKKHPFQFKSYISLKDINLLKTSEATEIFWKDKFMQAKTPKLMQDSSDFDETWPKKEQTQDFKQQLPLRPMLIKKKNKISRHLEYS